ncbi:aspartyl protease family protein At5g10770-like [Lolium rigidum]|uniref:aspartyl protease family protein At5g10770-like n=1 Tax=Lolium rigidum TaxID=89674 RepID=UPI001F5D30F5|nr:aspartyl protease family protein At5g10770-like [Lolium rigidum]
MDTGNDMSWMRCNTQDGGPFDPRASRSYAPFSCSSGECAKLVISKFAFGCSDTDTFDSRVDGILVLGGGAQSLLSQTATIYGRQFSYCLPPTLFSFGFLRLGAPGDDSSFTFTRMFRRNTDLTFYYVLLLGIKVAEKPLDLPPSVFTDGSVLDSSTVITRLPTTAYTALSSAFKEEMKAYPPGQQSGLLDTCFDFGGKDIGPVHRFRRP